MKRTNDVTLAISQLSPEDRKKLRENLDFIESSCDPEFMRELTIANRQAREGKVYSHEEVIEALKHAESSAV